MTGYVLALQDRYWYMQFISGCFLDRYIVNPPTQGWVYTTYLHSRTAAPLLLLWQSLQGVLIKSALVKDNVYGAGFVLGVVETLLSFWLH